MAAPSAFAVYRIFVPQVKGELMTQKQIDTANQILESVKADIIGYDRVSTYGQMDNTSLDSQEQLLRDRGATIIYTDVLTATNRERTQLQDALDSLKPGDTFMVPKMDRFARKAQDALNMVDELHNRGVIVHILDMGIFDNTPMGKLLFTVLAAFAEFEHALIKERLQGGRAWKRATEPDYRDGRKPTYSKEQKAHALQLLEDGDTFKQVTAKTGISRTQLYRLLDEKKEVAQ